MALDRAVAIAVPHKVEMPLIGTSEAIQKLDVLIDRAARSDAKVLITGETGAGKEVVARQIHARSPRRAMPLVALNCAGVPETLIESELFGFMRGAFTGAHRDKRGLLEAASGGTVFLDEVGEMSLRMQAVLLRFLQSGEIQRVGADRPHTRVNVRLVCATNRDLRKEVAEGNFREDLYFRLNVVTITVPPLRERLSDVPALIDFFLQDLPPHIDGTRVSISYEAMKAMCEYAWPGNVRELRNIVERLIVNARTSAIGIDDLPAHMRPAAPLPSPDANGNTPPSRPSPLVAELAGRMLLYGESFWTVVAEPLASHQLSRDDVKKVVRLGLDRTKGSYRNLVDLFNIPATDHARFLSFLQEHDCHLPVNGLRSEGPRPQARRGAETKF